MIGRRSECANPPRHAKNAEPVATTEDAGPTTWSTLSMGSIQWPESVTEMAPERLRWIADYLDLADQAISVVACVRGVDYPSDLHRGAQRDLRRWAHWLEVRPALAARLAVAMVVAVPDDGSRHRRPGGIVDVRERRAGPPAGLRAPVVWPIGAPVASPLPWLPSGVVTGDAVAR